MPSVEPPPPSPAEGRDADLFPLRARTRLRESFGLAVREIRRRPAFASLAKGPWSIFLAVAAHWQGNAEAWPSQETLALFSGWSSRAVREHVAVLERGGILRLRRERRADGTDRLYYAPGPMALAELDAFADRFPRERRHAPPSAATAPPPPEATSGTPPEATSGERRSPNRINPSSLESGTSTSPSTEEQKSSATAQDSELARAALRERMARKYPSRAPSAHLDADPRELAMVVACVGAVAGDDEHRAQTLRDAIDGAFAASKSGPPTVRFIWGTVEHFLDHAERGRRRREVAEKSARQIAEKRAATPSAASDPAPRIDPAKMTADLELLFGAEWGQASRGSSEIRTDPEARTQPAETPRESIPEPLSQPGAYGCTRERPGESRGPPL